ncbi:MAG: hypothetical protein EBV06_07705 [Planctomycetia bacterium]|nr:hypothetical protein [Planctomycetia bacterium]
MTRKSCRVMVFGTSLLLTAAVLAADTTPTADEADRETQHLLEQLKRVGDQILGNTQSPNLYRFQLDQGEILMKLAARSKPDGRDGWLRMAIDSYATAVSQAPENIPNVNEWMGQVANYVARNYPGSGVHSYIAYKSVYADHTRNLVKNGSDPGKVRDVLCERLMDFARNNPKAVEAPKAVLEVIEINETAKKVDAAKVACRFLMAAYPSDPMAKKAKETMWRLGLEGEQIDLKLPLLYSGTINAEETFDLQSVRGRLAVLYFWSSATAVDTDFSDLRDLGDKYRRLGLEVVFINTDATAAAGREYLSNKLTGGTHVFQKGGVEGEVTGRYGIRTLPETLLISTEGTLISRSANPSGIESGVVKLLGPVSNNSALRRR